MLLQSLQNCESNLKHVSATLAMVCPKSQARFCTPCIGLFQIAGQRYNIQIAVFE